MSSISIRRIVPEDAVSVAGLLADEAVYAEVLQLPFPSPTLWKKRIEDGLAVGGADIHVVAEMDGQVLGTASLNAGTAVRRRHATTLGIMVARQAQGQGVGSALMAALIDFADRWAGIVRIELTVYADNLRAIALYEKFGFQTEGRLHKFAYRDGRLVDALTMARFSP